MMFMIIVVQLVQLQICLDALIETEVTREETSREETTKEETTWEEITREETTREEITREEITREETIRKDLTGIKAEILMLIMNCIKFINKNYLMIIVFFSIRLSIFLEKSNQTADKMKYFSKFSDNYL